MYSVGLTLTRVLFKVLSLGFIFLVLGLTLTRVLYTGTQFTCFTSTKVEILTHSRNLFKPLWDPDQFNAFMDDFRRCLKILVYEVLSY